MQVFEPPPLPANTSVEPVPAQQRKLDRFRHDFNHERPHESIAMKRPAQLYRPSIRSFPSRIEPYDYSSHFLVRRFSRDGTIRVLRNQILVSNTLHDDFIGLEEIDDAVYDLFFCLYQIGRYHRQPNKTEDIVSRVPISRRQGGRYVCCLPPEDGQGFSPARHH